MTEFSERPVKTTIVFLPTISVESAAETVNAIVCSSPGDNVLLVHVCGFTTQLSDVSLGSIVNLSFSSPEFLTVIWYETSSPTATFCSV